MVVILKVLFGINQSFVPLLCFSLCGKHGGQLFGFFSQNRNRHVLMKRNSWAIGRPEPSVGMTLESGKLPISFFQFEIAQESFPCTAETVFDSFDSSLSEWYRH